jgi:hypothetical protein
MADEHDTLSLTWTPRVTYMGRSFTINSCKSLEVVEHETCWKIAPQHPSVLALVIDKSCSDVKDLSKQTGFARTICNSDTWKELIAARNAAQASIILSEGPVDQDKLAALYGTVDTTTRSNKLPSSRKHAAKVKSLLTFEIGGQQLRCVAPADRRDGMSVVLEKESLLAVFDFLSTRITEELAHNPGALGPRNYNKRKSDDTGAWAAACDDVGTAASSRGADVGSANVVGDVSHAADGGSDVDDAVTYEPS